VRERVGCVKYGKILVGKEMFLGDDLSVMSKPKIIGVLKLKLLS
jgi:hypothetical protein